MNNFPPTYSARENALKEDMPTPEQLQDALELMQDERYGFAKDFDTYKTIVFALHFTAKALGEPSEEANIEAVKVMAANFPEHLEPTHAILTGQPKDIFKAMIRQLCKEVAE